MQIQQVRNLQLNNNKAQKQPVTFKGGESLIGALNFIDTNPAWGAVLVDLISMVIPRTIVDFTRGPEAGVETGRRELTCSANMGLLGAYGWASAWALSHGFNKEYKGIKAHQIIVDGDTLDILSHAWDKHKTPQGFLTEIFDNVKGFNPNHKDNIEGWIEIPTATREQVIKKLLENIDKKDKETISETKAFAKALIADAMDGTEGKFRIESEIKKLTEVPTHSLEELIDKIYNVARNFKNPEVAQTFVSHNLKNNPFIKGLRNINARATMLGLSISVILGLLQQPVNMYLTKRKTGKAGFVGVENKEPDKSMGFKFLKTGLAILATVLAMRSIGKPSELLRNIQFKGINPTLNQFKFVYGLTIASRLLSSRDKHELRETSIRDSLGFANWLILGGFVSKLTALGIQNMAMFKKDGTKFIKYVENNEKTGFRKVLDWVQNSSLVSRDEVLHSALKNTIKPDSKKAMSLIEMLKEALKKAPSARTKVNALGIVQIAGYIYSCVVLGIGIPKLNIAITKFVEGKNKTQDKSSLANTNPDKEKFLNRLNSSFQQKTLIK